ncbi:MAG: PrsW family glutamic-type intramembrane protease [Acidobacteriota bacterium]
MLLYVVAATPARAVPGSFLLLLFGVGNVAVPWVTVGIQAAIAAVTTKNEGFVFGVIAPITEEVMKVLPVIVLYVWKKPLFRYLFGASDWMLCGAAVGSGVELWEDVLMRRTPSFPTSAPNLFGVPLIAGYWHESRGVFIGHVASAAFIALALGWARYLKRPSRQRADAAPSSWVAFRASRIFAYAPAALVLFWMMVDHAGNNLRTEHDWYWAPAHAVYYLSARGRLAAYVFLVAAAATIVIEGVLLTRMPAPRSPAKAGHSSGRRGWLRRLILSHQIRYVQLSMRPAVRLGEPRPTHP